ncbi:uncharacterized protein [Dasypus novemcinctus]|uniref:uncharacterized protein n=1 Tax=Dasypus novemcinctus TaxID=9361 RepID=UPI00265E2899|nr:epididymal-specific lipocalin-9 [Dasypus novemcinctus]
MLQAPRQTWSWLPSSRGSSHPRNCAEKRHRDPTTWRPHDPPNLGVFHFDGGGLRSPRRRAEGTPLRGQSQDAGAPGGVDPGMGAALLAADPRPQPTCDRVLGPRNQQLVPAGAQRMPPRRHAAAPGHGRGDRAVPLRPETVGPGGYKGCSHGPGGHRGPRRAMALLLLLLSLGLSLASAQNLDRSSIVQQDFDMDKVTGKWHSISMVSDNMTRIQANGDLRIFMQEIEHLRNGSLQFRFMFRVQGECVQVAVVCEKTAKNGMFTIPYEGQTTVRIAETNYRLYIVFYLRNVKTGKETRVLALYGQVPELSSPFLERFKEVCLQYGFRPEHIISLPRNGGASVLGPRRWGGATPARPD